MDTEITKVQTKASQIIKLWEITKVVHPSYGEIARQVGTNKGYCWKVIEAHKKRTAGKN